MVEPKAFQDALLAYHARPADREAEAVRAAALGAFLTKMPTLDPSWPEQVQEGWMRCFNALRALADGVKGLRKIDGKPHCGCAAGPECKATWCTRGVMASDGSQPE